jgi:outer membrane receptor protein involved in Fe transport
MYKVVDFSAQRSIGRNLEAFFGVENAFDRQYFVGTLPTTIGTPRLVNGGVRIRWSGQ